MAVWSTIVSSSGILATIYSSEGGCASPLLFGYFYSLVLFWSSLLLAESIEI